MDTQKLKVKDLVTIGVFAIIYFIVYYAVGMIGLVPILYLVFPAVFAVVGGVIVMLFMAKEQKPWAGVLHFWYASCSYRLYSRPYDSFPWPVSSFGAYC